MKKEILVSLGDERVKDVAEVLGNASCVRILDLLAFENLAVSDIAKRLEMRINTVDYNVKKLVRAGLIEKADYWWSVKGKKMPIYCVSDRKIVISPRRNVVKRFLWVLGLTGVAALWIRSFVFEGGDSGIARDVAENAVFGAAPEAKMMVTDVGARVGVESVGFWAGLAGWEWFLFGAWVSIVLFFVYSMVSERKNGSLL